MNAATSASTVNPHPLSSSLGIGCPLNHGTAVVDQLLAAITRDSSDESFDAALDAALDLRLLLAGETDADTILAAFFRVRQIAEERHYLACFRLRRWLETQFCARVYFNRCEPPRTLPLILDLATCADLRARCACLAADDVHNLSWVRVQFARNAAATPALT